jgi:endo-1,4-beta-mannosidase
MSQWTSDKAFEWYSNEEWPIGANFLPSSAINQLEMFQNETYDKQTITKELRMANSLGFNSMRVYLHDLLWNIKDEFLSNFEEFLKICDELNIKPIIVLFDDCHRSDPKLGKQFLPVRGIHNSGWSQSPGHKIVKEIHNGKKNELPRLKKFTQEILDLYKNDNRILLWDIYNEPGQFGIG